MLIFSEVFFLCSEKTVYIDIAEIDHDRILTAAVRFLNEEPITITSYLCERSAGGIHDFYSEGDYWWPNPDDPNGPFVRRDGISNPNNFNKHRQLMSRLSIQVPTLVAAYKLTHDKIYLIKP